MSEPDRDPDILLDRAIALLDLRRPDEALRLLHRAALIAPENSITYCLLTRCLLDIGDLKEALDSAHRAVSVAPDLGVAHVWRSAALLRNGRRKDALEAARTGVGLDPEDPQAHSVLAYAALVNRNKAEAEEAAKKSVDLDPERPGGYVALAQVAIARRKWAEAESHARTALSLNPHYDMALEVLGDALTKQQRHAEAIEAYAGASRSDPRDPEPRSKAILGARRLAGGVAIGASFGLVFVMRRVLEFLEKRYPVLLAIVLGFSALIVVVGLVYSIRLRMRKRKMSPVVEELVREERAKVRREAKVNMMFGVLAIEAVFAVGLLTELVGAIRADNLEEVLGYGFGVAILGLASAISIRFTVRLWRG